MSSETDNAHWQSLEDDLRQTDKKVSAIEAHLNSLTNTVSTLASDLREFMRLSTQRMNEANKTNWGPILTALGLLGGAVAGYSTMLFNPLAERMDRVEYRSEDRVERLDVSLQREMRDLDTVLQREISLTNQATNKRIDAVQDLVERLESWRLETHRAAIDDKDELERKVFDLQQKLIESK